MPKFSQSRINFIVLGLHHIPLLVIVLKKQNAKNYENESESNCTSPSPSITFQVRAGRLLLSFRRTEQLKPPEGHFRGFFRLWAKFLNLR